jgi:processive 1,2-diacylglycerol beta-glucosyltransferase
MPKRILVLSASVGAGHIRAAEAVELALKQLDPEAEVRNIDLLDLTNAAFRRLYGKLYIDLVNTAPHLLGLVYEMLDKPRSPKRKSDRLRLAVESLNLGKFIKLLKGETWDVIVNTHFLPAGIIASLRAKKQIATPQLTATTDFETHRMWVNEPCDHYFTATDEGAAYLAHWGVAPERISVTGIPIHPAFSVEKDARQCRRRLGLGNDRPVIVQMGGGFGMGPVEKIYAGLLAVDRPLEIVVVAGRNEPLKARLEKAEVPSQHRAHVLGFTREIDELMAAADIVISKPGGLTTSEVLARGAAMIIANPVPGQETRNSDYILENGAGVKINNLPTLSHKLGRLLDEPQRLQQMKAAARKLGRPQAAFDVARAALQWKT